MSNVSGIMTCVGLVVLALGYAAVKIVFDRRKGPSRQASNFKESLIASEDFLTPT